jgi:hypothetical protein
MSTDHCSRPGHSSLTTQTTPHLLTTTKTLTALLDLPLQAFLTVSSIGRLFNIDFRVVAVNRRSS